SWSDDISHNLKREHYFDQLSCLTLGSNVKNGINAGGSMYAKSDESFEDQEGRIVYVGNSERIQRHKKSAAKIATAGISKLDTFFFTPQQIPHQSAREFTYNLKKLEKDQEQEGFELA
ncbi:8604_t:CDS:2, partial [Funneliformis geosporum]